MRALRLLFPFLLATSFAHAQPGDAAKAEALFRAARALMKSGEFALACPKLEQSYRLDPAAGTAVNLGDCFEKLGRLADALRAQRNALQLLRATDPRVAPVKRQLAALDKRVPRLTINLDPHTPKHAIVTLNGSAIPRQRIGQPTPLNPGVYMIAVEAEGRAPHSTKIELAERQSRKIVVGVGPNLQLPKKEHRPAGAVDRPGSSANAHDESSDGVTQRAIGFAVGGAGLVGAGIGLFAWHRAGQHADRAEATCPTSPCDAKAIYDSQRADEESNRARANVAFLVGGFALAGGAALVLTAPSQKPETTPRSVSLSSTVSNRHVGVRLGGAW